MTEQQAFQYSVSPNNIHLDSSYLVGKEEFEPLLREMRKQYPECLVWNRSIPSLKREWAVHNFCHAFGVFRSRTAHTDLDWPQSWLLHIGYEVVGTLVWPFIK